MAMTAGACHEQLGSGIVAANSSAAAMHACNGSMAVGQGEEVAQEGKSLFLFPKNFPNMHK
jgi:hypothetical protein